MLALGFYDTIRNSFIYNDSFNPSPGPLDIQHPDCPYTIRNSTGNNTIDISTFNMFNVNNTKKYSTNTTINQYKNEEDYYVEVTNPSYSASTYVDILVSEVEPNTNFTISGETISGNLSKVEIRSCSDTFYSWNNPIEIKTGVGTFNETFSISSSSAKYLGLRLYGQYESAGEVQTSVYKNIMIYKGDKIDTTYQPYTDVVEQRTIKLSGKNLYQGTDTSYEQNEVTITISNNGTKIVLNGTCDSTFYKVINTDMYINPKLIGNTVSYSAKVNDENVSYSCWLGFIDEDENTHNTFAGMWTASPITGSQKAENKIMDSNASKYRIVIGGVNGVIYDNFEIDLQIEEGTTATEYEPYCGYNYSLMKDDYITKKGVIHHNRTHITFNGTENWNMNSLGQFYLDIKDNIKLNKTVSSKLGNYCSHFIELSNNEINSEMEGFSVATSTYRVYFYYKDFSKNKDLAGFKAWLINQYNRGTPLMLEYTLKAETTETIPSNSKLADQLDSLDYFYNLDEIPEIIDNLKTLRFTDCSYLFSGGMRLDELDELSKYTTFSGKAVGMFSNCYGLMRAPQLNTQNITDMSSMFSGCTYLTSIQNLNSSNTLSTKEMFSGCRALTTVPLLDTSNVTNMQNMFYDCRALTTVPLFDTSKVTNMCYMFFQCYALTTVPQFNTSNVTNIEQIFYKCTSLTTVPLFVTSSVTNMRYMFGSCTSLTTVPQFNTSSVTNIQQMFNGCTALSNESLNNILAMCTNAVKITNTSQKKLSYIGLSTTQINKCKTLSNYQAFLDAGWTAD